MTQLDRINQDIDSISSAYIKNAIKCGVVCYVRISGNSMFPVLKHGETISIIGSEAYFLGDVIVFQYKSRTLVHRLLAIKEGRYFIKGDNSLRMEDVCFEDIIGRVLLQNDPLRDDRFIISSLTIGKLYHKLGFQDSRLMSTEEYQKHLIITAQCLHTGTYCKLKNERFIDNLPLPKTPYAIIKGMPMFLMAYNNLSIRPSCDIDILMPTAFVDQYLDQLLKSGFNRVDNNRFNQIAIKSISHQTMPLYKSLPIFGDLIVDINTDLMWGEFDKNRIDVEHFLNDTLDVNIYNRTVKSLTPLKSFVQLALHNYKDLNSIFLLSVSKRINFRAFFEPYLLLINNLDSISVDSLAGICQKYQIMEYVYYILHYSFLLFKDKRMVPYINSLKTDEGERLLNMYGLCDAERKKWRIDFRKRIESDNIYSSIQSDLNDRDIRKLEFNKKVFGSGIQY